MARALDPSIVGLITQFAAITLVAMLAFLMTRSIRRPFLQYWAVSWALLALSLGVLLAAFRFPALRYILMPLYMTGEYAFGYLFYAGCRNYKRKELFAPRERYLILVGFGAAILLTALARTNFDILFVPHSAIVAYLFTISLRVLAAKDPAMPHTPGIRVMSAALVLLTIDFLHYIPVFVYVAVSGVQAPLGHLAYSSLYDLVLEVLLGFGMVMAILEDVARELEWSNAELLRSRDRMETIARLDPLTHALNRHGFYSLIEKHPDGNSGELRGCVGIIDMDNLKVINDSLGHCAGDEAIRAVARAVRTVIRAEDQLVRWGGDEFLILIFGLPAADARARFERIQAALNNTALPGSGECVSISVSYGLGDFSSDVPLYTAIEKADSAMYMQKLMHRRRRAKSGTDDGKPHAEHEIPQVSGVQEAVRG